MMEGLESSFYDGIEMKKAMLKKSSMTLDFSKGKQKKLGQMLLNTPDVNMLKLASPELERMIIQQGAITTTPTPTTQILFPKSVTEEQEAYARGFVDALAELHTHQEDSSNEATDMEAPESTYTTLTTLSSVPSTHFSNILGSIRPAPASLLKSVPATSVNPSTVAYTTVTQLPGTVLSQNVTNAPTTITVPSGSMAHRSQDIIVQNQPMVISRNASPALQQHTNGHHNQVLHIKTEEPQRVPSLSPQIAPINMVHQEGIKLDRKRARNRIAARKCRTRKLERISRLEDRVDDLKDHNTTLVDTASDLREQVFKLKQQILEHVSSGCKVMLSANML